MPNSALVHVVDDDIAMRESLAFLLDAAGFAVRLYESARPFLENETAAIGCVLTDIRMPDIDGLELLRRIRAEDRDLPVIVMTGHGDVPLAVEAMKLGASDFIEKPFDDEQLLRAVRSALSHGPAPDTRDPARDAFHARLASLSRREREVFERLVAGDTNKAIARHLAISPRTVEIYRANVMSKMAAGSLSDLVRAAVHAGVA